MGRTVRHPNARTRNISANDNYAKEKEPQLEY